MIRWIAARVLIGLMVGLVWKTAAAEDLPVRLTHYLPTGNPMANGQMPYRGAAACSTNLRLGTVVVLPNGQRLVCADRGLLGSTGWIDVFVTSLAEGRALTAALGDYITVSVER